MLLRLKLEDVEDELEGLADLERLLARDKLAHLNHLQVKHVVDETEEQVHLTYEQEDQPFARFLHLELHHVFENHQARAQRGAKLVR